MHLQIGQVSLAPYEHTAKVLIENKYDDTGLDTLWTEVNATMICVWSQFAVATQSTATIPGDVLGITVRNLRTVLMARGQLVTLTIGPDRVFTSPLQGPFAVGTVLPCDPMGGPFVDADVLEIHGDKTAIVRVHVRFAFNDDNSYVLSNRWTTTSKTDGASWLTTRQTQGRAILRMDFMQEANNANLDPTVVPDQFRRAFVLPCPLNFIRTDVNVVATPNGQELLYTVTDQEMRLNLGNNSPIAKLEGDATFGIDWPFKALTGIGGYAANLAVGAARKAGDFVGAGSIAFNALTLAWGMFVATPKARVVTRVTGNAGAAADVLSKFAIQTCLDRFASLSLFDKTLLPISAFLTIRFDADKPLVVEAKFEFLPGNNRVSVAMFDTTQLDLALNLNQSIADSDGKVLAALSTANTTVNREPVQLPNFGNPRLPASNNTRGTYIAKLVAQILATGSVGAGNYIPVGDTPGDGVPARDEMNLG